MSISHLSPYFYYSVLCSGRILMLMLNVISNCTLYLHANVRNVKLSEYDILVRNANRLSSVKYGNCRERQKHCNGFTLSPVTV